MKLVVCAPELVQDLKHFTNLHAEVRHICKLLEHHEIVIGCKQVTILCEIRHGKFSRFRRLNCELNHQSRFQQLVRVEFGNEVAVGQHHFGCYLLNVQVGAQKLLITCCDLIQIVNELLQSLQTQEWVVVSTYLQVSLRIQTITH